MKPLRPPLCFNMTTLGAAIESGKKYRDLIADSDLQKKMDAQVATSSAWNILLRGDLAFSYLYGTLLVAQNERCRAIITLDKRFWADVLDMGFSKFKIEKTAVRIVPSIDPEAVSIEYTPYNQQESS